MTMQSSLGSESLNQEKDELELKKLQEENKRWESDVKSFKETDKRSSKCASESWKFHPEQKGCTWSHLRIHRSDSFTCYRKIQEQV